MKLPRWLIATLIATTGFAILAAGLVWWITWPQRTAFAFAAAMASEDFDRALGMMTQINGVKESTAALDLLDPYQWKRANIRATPRSFREIREARQSFELANNWTMTVERDRVEMVGLQLILFHREKYFIPRTGPIKAE